MVANLCLLTCALLTGQAADPEGQLLPRLSRGQELVYRGSLVEEAIGSGVQFGRTYRLETRVFMLQTQPQGTEVAFFTVLRQRPARSERGDETEPSSVRLELARVDPQGRIVADSPTALAVPLEGPTTVECGAFVEMPRGRWRPDQSWQVSEDGRPTRRWRVLGTEAINGTTCLKLEGLQQSDDWDQPRADRTAWRRRDLVWLTPRLGVAQRLERTLERREPARVEPTQRSVLRYELESSIPFPGQLYEDRQHEIQQARLFAETAAPLLPNPAKSGPRSLDLILAKIAHHLETHPPTPYREAVLQVKRRVEAARRGEVPPTGPVADAGSPPVMATLGQRAPDFLATNLLTGASARLQHWQGRVVALAFYQPSSRTAAEVLRFLQALQEAHPDVLVVGFSTSEDVDQVRQQHRDLGLTFPLLAGKGLRQTFAVEATPKLIVLDAEGIVRRQMVGWGQEAPGAIIEEIQRWQRKDGRSRPEGAGPAKESDNRPTPPAKKP